MQRRTFLSATSVLAATVGLGGGEARASTPPARTLSVFNSVSLDGFFTDESSDMSWAHTQDPEWNQRCSKASPASRGSRSPRRARLRMAMWFAGTSAPDKESR
jgi:hypothetical protein